MEVQEIPEDYPLYAYKTGALNDEQARQHFGTLRCQVSLSGFFEAYWVCRTCTYPESRDSS